MAVRDGSRVDVSGGSTIANSTAGQVRHNEAQSGVCVRMVLPVLWVVGRRHGWHGLSINVREGGGCGWWRAVE
jgi:hypothetical protein